jgi:phosphoribosylanthranilate isomerase
VRTRVKICGITRIEDGIAAAKAGADAIGVVLWRGTPRYVDVDRAADIVRALPPFVKVVGLFVDPAPAEVTEALARIPLDLLQFHGSEPATFCRSFDRPYLKAIAVKDGVDLLEYAAQYDDAAGLLFDAFAEGELPGGTGVTFDWMRLSDHVRARIVRPIVLSGGLDASNVEAAIRAVNPWGVDVSSGVEARDAEGRPRRGIKDAARIAAFVQGVRNADDGSARG